LGGVEVNEGNGRLPRCLNLFKRLPRHYSFPPDQPVRQLRQVRLGLECAVNMPATPR